jgi:hypothetical protein
MSCEKTQYKSTGTIKGADMAMCVCCGGYFIEIEGIQFRFEKTELPGNFTFSDSQLPLQVELNWEVKAESCSGFNWIKISDIRKM